MAGTNGLGDVKTWARALRGKLDEEADPRSPLLPSGTANALMVKRVIEVYKPKRGILTWRELIAYIVIAKALNNSDKAIDRIEAVDREDAGQPEQGQDINKILAREMSAINVFEAQESMDDILPN